MIHGTKQAKVCKFKWAHLRQIIVMVSVGAESHRGYATERVRSSAAECQSLAPGAWTNWSPK